MFGRKKQIPIELTPFQINKLKKIKGKFLVVTVGDKEHYVSKETIDHIAETLRKKLPKGITFFVVPHWIRFEMSGGKK